MRSLVLIPLVLLSACNWAGEKTKSVLNKGGELAGSAATEVIEGVTTGIEDTWSVDVRLSEDLKVQGLALGKTSFESDSAGRTNTLIVYLSSERAITDTLTAVAYDQAGAEMGRTSIPLNIPAGSGDFHLLRFQAYTDLERKGRVELR
ncbi:MAG TPA: hypothetical protein PLB89_08545 [Flavobacteriales bacterium]|nr:hypothetical protein [Flavobacteriales bacterium]